MTATEGCFWREREFNSAHGRRLPYYRPEKGPMLKERFSKLEQNRTNAGLSRLAFSNVLVVETVNTPLIEAFAPRFNTPAPITKVDPQNKHVNSPDHLSFPDDLSYSFNKGFLHMVEPLKAVQSEHSIVTLPAYVEDDHYKMGYPAEE